MKDYNRHIFDEINSSEKAYWLGFIVADGYLNTERGMLRIKLGNIDKHHLEKFINFLGGDETMLKSEIHNITGNIQWYVSTYSKEIKDALLKLNVVGVNFKLGLFPALTADYSSIEGVC